MNNIILAVRKDLIRTSLVTVLLGLLISFSAFWVSAQEKIENETVNETSEFEETNDSMLEQDLGGVMRTLQGLGVRPLSIEEVPIKGLRVVETDDNQVIYISDDGKYVFGPESEILEVHEEQGRLINLTEEKRKTIRSEMLMTLSSDETIDFAPEEEDSIGIEYYVFTDYTCGYCALLHKEIDQYTDAGITVRYLAYPRAGVESDSYHNLVSAWCADDPKAALTLLKNGKNIKTKDCVNPVVEHLKLGKKMGVTGTPAGILSDGTFIRGYMEAERIIEYIRSLVDSS